MKNQKAKPVKVTITIEELDGRLGVHTDTHGTDVTDQAIEQSPALMLMMMFQQLMFERCKARRGPVPGEGHKC